jgi:hypothetical protein
VKAQFQSLLASKCNAYRYVEVTVVRAIGYTGAQMGGAVCGTLLSRALDPKAFDAVWGLYSC